MDNKNKIKNLVLVLSIVCVVGAVIGVSYAYWTLRITQKSPNIVGTDCLSLEIVDESDGITLNTAHPITNEEGMKLTPYTFTVKNTCDSLIDYKINLESLNVDNRMGSNNIAVSFDDKNIDLLSNFDSADPTYKDATYTGIESHTLLSGFLDKNESSSHTLRLWIASSSGNESQNKNFFSKIVVSGTPNEVLATLPDLTVSYLDANGDAITDFNATKNFTYESSVALTCNEEEKSSCYIKITKDLDYTGNIISMCGTASKPGDCEEISNNNALLPNTWYKTSKNIVLTPKSGETEQIQVTSISCVGNDCSKTIETTLYVQDKDAPVITVNSVENINNGAIIHFNVEENLSGIESIVCKYGNSEDNLNLDGTLNDNICTISNFVGSEIYYSVEASDYVKNLGKKTGSIKVNENLTAPTITTDGDSYGLSKTIRVSVAGTADSGVDHYEYYISKSNEVPSNDVTATGTTSDTITVTDSGVSYVFYRTVSNAGNKSSWSGAAVANIYYKASSIEYNGNTIPNVSNVQEALDIIRGIR